MVLSCQNLSCTVKRLSLHAEATDESFDSASVKENEQGIAYHTQVMFWNTTRVTEIFIQ